LKIEKWKIIKVKRMRKREREREKKEISFLDHQPSSSISKAISSKN